MPNNPDDRHDEAKHREENERLRCMDLLRCPDLIFVVDLEDLSGRNNVHKGTHTRSVVF